MKITICHYNYKYNHMMTTYHYDYKYNHTIFESPYRSNYGRLQLIIIITNTML